MYTRGYRDTWINRKHLYNKNTDYMQYCFDIDIKTDTNVSIINEYIISTRIIIYIFNVIFGYLICRKYD